nr:immunoglobulin heavy chain junction region [Homo sapiens]
GSEKYYVDSVK